MPGVVVSLAALALVLYLAEPAKLVEALRLADYRLVVAGVFLTLLWEAVRTLVWRTLLRDQPTFSQVFFTVNEGYLLNNLLPFRLGEVGRAFLMSRKAGLGFWEVASSILIERILDVAMAAGLLLVTLSFVVGAPWARQAALGSGLLVAAGLAALYLLARYRAWALAQFERLGARRPSLLRLGGERLASFFTGLAVLTEGARFLRVIFWMALNWLVAVVQYTILLLAFFPRGAPLWAAFTLAVAALGIALPSSPGSVGVYEASVVGALAVFRLDPSTALAFALTAHLLNYLVTSLLGAVGLARDGETLAGLFRRVQRIPRATPDL